MFERPSFTDRQLSDLDTLIENAVLLKVEEIMERIQNEKQALQDKGLFEKERLSLRKASSLAAMHWLDFMKELDRRKIALHYDESLL